MLYSDGSLVKDMGPIVYPPIVPFADEYTDIYISSNRRAEERTKTQELFSSVTLCLRFGYSKKCSSLEYIEIYFRNNPNPHY